MGDFVFCKMHGLGNSFVLADDREGEVARHGDLAALARLVCDRNYGLGGDGLILVRRSPSHDLRMTIINSDGSEAEMCGNGIRCFARFARDQGITRRDELTVETLAGPIRTALTADGRVRVDMGEPRLESADLTAHGPTPGHVEIDGRTFTFVSMGNPHVVTFVDDHGFDWRAAGAAVELHPAFPNRTNVEFVRVAGRNEIDVKVWERGCGATLACGTGACASVVAGVLERRLDRGPVLVHLPGGDLEIEWAATGHALMTGPTATVAHGRFVAA